MKSIRLERGTNARPAHPTWTRFFGASLALLVAGGCAVVQPGEVGVKSKWGKLDEKVHTPGLVGLNRISSRLYRVPTQTVNREVQLNLPSKEGLNVSAEISILYHIQAERAPDVIRDVGLDYEEVLILSVFRSASADICARFFAKDMHSGKRAEIEAEIQKQMGEQLAERGFVIEAVLLKSIRLPPGLYTAIEDKLEAEQEAQRMQFVLQREQREAERKTIEAQGVRDAQKVLADGLSEEIIRWRSLEVLQELASSPNAKLIVTDGSAPVFFNEDVGGTPP
ncbi:MAG: prohibitin family protein [Myxococcota bacterium]